jgi:putative acetyltransferase
VNGPRASSIEVRSEPPDQPAVRELLDASDRYLALLYPAESNHLTDVAALSAPGVHFVVARTAGRAVGCGAIVDRGAGVFELKRMWVDPAARGLGIGGRVLDVLEAHARSRGARVVRLETGIRQPEALALYRRRGYGYVPAFPPYDPDPLSVFMEKPA